MKIVKSVYKPRKEIVVKINGVKYNAAFGSVDEVLKYFSQNDISGVNILLDEICVEEIEKTIYYIEH